MMDDDDDGRDDWLGPIITTASTPDDLDAAIAKVTAAMLEDWHRTVFADRDLTTRERRTVEAVGAARIVEQTRVVMLAQYRRLQQGDGGAVH